MNIKNLKNLLNNTTIATPIRKYSPSIIPIKEPNCVSNSCHKKIDPNFISGIMQADGSFFITLRKRKKTLRNCGVFFDPTVTLTLHWNSESTLQTINTYFNSCGTIVQRPERGAAEWVVKTAGIEKELIPHFLKYPLFGNKWRAFQGVLNIINALKTNQHMHYQTFLKMVFVCTALNHTFISQQKSTFIRKKSKVEPLLNISLPNTIDLSLPEYNDFFLSPEAKPFELNDQFILGLIDGDGSFTVAFRANAIIRFDFQIVGDASQRVLFEHIKKRLSCGTIQQESENLLKYKVVGKMQILAHIIPFMEISTHVLHTKKKEYYDIFKRVILQVESFRQKRTKKEFLEVVALAYDMNLGGKRRALTKEEYLKKYAKDINKLK